MYVIDRHRVKKRLMMTSDDYILRIYISTYVEEIISVKYERCAVILTYVTVSSHTCIYYRILRSYSGMHKGIYKVHKVKQSSSAGCLKRSNLVNRDSVVGLLVPMENCYLCKG